MDQADPNQRLAVLLQEIRRLQANLPAHSVPPSMLIRLEELEEELANLQVPEPCPIP